VIAFLWSTGQSERRRLDNTPSGHQQIAAFTEHTDELELIVMESTRGYQQALADHLREASLARFAAHT
jgi:transposase